MKLYHGTTEAFALEALKKGLRPRGRRKSNWPDAASCKDAVYLTNAYPLYYAINATDPAMKTLPAIIEIDTLHLDEDLLAPDEDAIEQVTRRNNNPCPEGWSMLKRTRYFRDRLADYTGMDQWLTSLKALGNCTYLGTIPPEAMTRMAVIDPAKASTVCWMAMDAQIILPNYNICGAKYRALTKWIFNDDLGEDVPVKIGELPNFGAVSTFTLPPEAERDGIVLRSLELARV
jgi:hypothetical protein